MNAPTSHKHTPPALDRLEYEFDAGHGVWVRSGSKAFAYSDGDEVEQRIEAALRDSVDLSLFSIELRRHQTDWPSIYHLSPARANLLRPMARLFEGAKILEIGAGCGAITRYLGEQGGEVLALEGSPRRARIAASRCRDLPNVAVACDRFDAFDPKQRFDVITLIGVLEYARLYTGGADAVQETLRKAFSLLSDDGVLIVAIENQLGLKYFAGVHEDHLGRAMAGIQDHYDAEGVVTFGKGELDARLRRAGFATVEFALPFPDYKLPQCVVLPSGYAEDNGGFDAASLAGQATRADRQLQHASLFAMGPAFGVLGRNGLLADLSNSFLVLAGKSGAAPGFADLAPDMLAAQYSAERQAAFTKATQFMRRGDGITVERKRLCPDSDPVSAQLVSQLLETEPYLWGVNWADRLDAILSREGWAVADVADWLSVWRDALHARFGGQAPARLELDTPVPGHLIDALPRNLVVAGAEARFFDLEWVFEAPLTFGYLAYRAIGVSLASVSGIASPADQALLHVPTMIRAVLRHLGYLLTATHLQTYFDYDAALHDQVAGRIAKPLSLNAFEGYVLETTPNITSFLQNRSVETLQTPYARVRQLEVEKSAAEFERDQSQAQLELANEELQKQADALQRTRDALELKTSEQAQTLGSLQQTRAENERLKNAAVLQDEELLAIKNSRSWALTAPLRTFSAFARSAAFTLRSSAARGAERLYRMLPISQERKQRVKGLLFRRSGGVLRNTRSYLRWQAYELDRAAARRPATAALTRPASTALPAPIQTQAIWQADGVREWAEYEPMRERIDRSSAAAREQASTKALAMLDFAGQDAYLAAARIKLPQPPAIPDVTILVPAYNHLTTTLECLASIAAAADPAGPSFEIIVADDASTDKTADVLATIPHLRVLSQSENAGFLRNCNSAAKHALGRNLLLLNNDVQVSAGWLSAMTTLLESDTAIGAVGPRIVYPNGRLQEAGARLQHDGTAEMIGLNESPDAPNFSYDREVDYCSGACLLLRSADFARLGGFDERYAPAYCEDSDLCMRLRAEGKRIMYCAGAEVAHHLSKTSDGLASDYKLACIARNLQTFSSTWQKQLDRMDQVRTIAFYLPQFHPIPENDLWWGRGFTEWTNVTKARPNFDGHYQPRVPADLGYYDLRIEDVMRQQAELARRYGVHGFCFYYYWFAGKRLLERPIEQMLASDNVNMPFCLCWANENWTRRWDGEDREVLIAQGHSPDDDLSVIRDLMRYFANGNYIRVDGKPLLLIYRVALFPDFAKTARRWREICRAEGIGEIYLALVESFELTAAGIKPDHYGCDAAVEFPPHGMAEPYPLTAPLFNPEYQGSVADYRDLAARFATRPFPDYKRFPGVMPGWDNTPRRQNHSFVFEESTPGAFQAWLEITISRTKRQYCGDERLVFINAWNEWAEGAYLEPDRRFGHAYLEAVRNAQDAPRLMRHNSYSLGE